MKQKLTIISKGFFFILPSKRKISVIKYLNCEF